MAWLLREGDVLAAVQYVQGGWPETIQGALIRRGPALVHTFGCGSALDLAWCADIGRETGEPRLEVRRIACVGPHRMARPQRQGGAVVAAEPGAFERWNLQVGDRLEIQDT